MHHLFLEHHNLTHTSGKENVVLNVLSDVKDTLRQHLQLFDYVTDVSLVFLILNCLTNTNLCWIHCRPNQGCPAATCSGWDCKKKTATQSFGSIGRWQLSGGSSCRPKNEQTSTKIWRISRSMYGSNCFVCHETLIILRDIRTLVSKWVLECDELLCHWKILFL